MPITVSTLYNAKSKEPGTFNEFGKKSSILKTI